MAGSRQPGPTCQFLGPSAVEDGTTARLPGPLPSPAGVSANPVLTWDTQAKLLAAARRAIPLLPAEARAQFAALFSPAAIEATVAVFAAWGAAHAFGVGEGIDVLLLGVGWVYLGSSVFTAGRDLWDFVRTASAARTEAELDAAARYLADAVVMIGVATFVAMIMRGGSRLGARAAAAAAESARLDALTEQMLAKVFGSTSNLGTLQRANMRKVVEFLDAHNVRGGDRPHWDDPDWATKVKSEWANLIKGMDLHSPVKRVELEPGEEVGMYVDLGRDPSRQVGQWLVRSRGAVSDRNLGISGNGRQYQVFTVNKPLDALQTKAAPIQDGWTTGRATRTIQGRLGPDKPLLTTTTGEDVSGGGVQYFAPDAPAGGNLTRVR